MQEDVSISATTALAATLWVIGAGFILLSFWHGQPFGAIGVFFGVTASTVQIRGLIRIMERRERLAFDLGRDSVSRIR